MCIFTYLAPLLDLIDLNYYRLMEVGEEFCGSKSDELQESIRKQSLNYFMSYHSQRLDELRIFFENEIWEICPVKPTFDILQLQVSKQTYVSYFVLLILGV